MQIKMSETRKGSPDGVTVKEYEKGQVYDVPDALGEVFVANKWAKPNKAAPGPSETKDGE